MLSSPWWLGPGIINLFVVYNACIKVMVYLLEQLNIYSNPYYLEEKKKGKVYQTQNK